MWVLRPLHPQRLEEVTEMKKPNRLKRFGLLTRRDPSRLGQRRVLLYFVIFAGCFDELEAPPPCFEAPAPLDNDAIRASISRRGLRAGGFCSDGERTCLMVYAGVERLSELSISENLAYPYLATLTEEKVSAEFSLCAPRCESPECDCLTDDECEAGYQCISHYFTKGFNFGDKRTSCLPSCDLTRLTDTQLSSTDPQVVTLADEDTHCFFNGSGP